MEECNIVKSYQDLLVWQKGRRLVAAIYTVTSHFPTDEKFGLTSQIKRAAISIPSNIAEGSSKRSTKEFIRFLNIAYGSLCEVETQLFLAQDLGFLVHEESLKPLLDDTAELGRMINGLIRSLNQRINTLNSELQTPNSTKHYA